MPTNEIQQIAQPIEQQSAQIQQTAAPEESACGASSCCPYTTGAIAIAIFAVGFLLGRLGRGKASKEAARKAPAPQRGNTRGRDGERRTRREDRPERREENVVRDRARLEEPVRGPIPPGSVELYVGNLSYATDDEALAAAFAPFGALVHARVVLNRFNGKSKGFGFVVMTNRADAEKAIAAMNEAELDGRRLRVNEARTGDSAE